MAKPTGPDTPAKPATTREQRLKAALRANLARRKAQARARAGQEQKTDAKSGR